jgi:hypothetical protein
MIAELRCEPFVVSKDRADISILVTADHGVIIDLRYFHVQVSVVALACVLSGVGRIHFIAPILTRLSRSAAQ